MNFHILFMLKSCRLAASPPYPAGAAHSFSFSIHRVQPSTKSRGSVFHILILSAHQKNSLENFQTVNFIFMYLQNCIYNLHPFSSASTTCLLSLFRLSSLPRRHSGQTLDRLVTVSSIHYCTSTSALSTSSSSRGLTPFGWDISS